MGLVFSLHSILQEHFHSALNQEPTNVCAALNVGKWFMVGGGVLGIAASCYYLIFSPHKGAMARSYTWTPVVEQRVSDFYFYYGCSLIVIAPITIAVIAQSSSLMDFLTRNTFNTTGGTLLLLWITAAIAHGIDYNDLEDKQVWFTMYTVFLAGSITPICLLGQEVMLKAVGVTAGVLGVGSLLAMIAPSGWVHAMTLLLFPSYLIVGLSNLGSVVWPTSMNLGAHLYVINLYGGVVIHSFVFIFFCHNNILRAEATGEENRDEYDPIDAAMYVSVITLDVFLRVAALLAGGGDGVLKKVCPP